MLFKITAASKANLTFIYLLLALVAVLFLANQSFLVTGIASGHWLATASFTAFITCIQPAIYLITLCADPQLVDGSLYSRSGDLGAFQGHHIPWCRRRALPYENKVYAGTAPIALVCLTFMWLSLAVGISVRLRFAKPVRLGLKFPRFTFLGVMLSSLLVFPWLIIRLWQDRMALLNGEAQTESFIRVLLSDYSFLLFFSLVSCSLLSSLNFRRSVAMKRLYSFIFVGFVLALTFVAGSKGGILIIFNLMIIYAISYQKTQPGGNVFVPTVTFVGLLAPQPPFHLELPSRQGYRKCRNRCRFVHWGVNGFIMADHSDNPR